MVRGPCDARGLVLGCLARNKKADCWAMREQGKRQTKNGPFVAGFFGPDPVVCYWAWAGMVAFQVTKMGLEKIGPKSLGLEPNNKKTKNKIKTIK